MTETPQLSGVDLARIALRAAKVAAQKNCGGPYGAAEAAYDPGGPARRA
jgi:hypothetical protein